MSTVLEFGKEVTDGRVVKQFVTVYTAGIIKYTEEVLMVADDSPLDDYLTTTTVPTDAQVGSVSTHLQNYFTRRYDRLRWFSTLFNG